MADPKALTVMEARRLLAMAEIQGDTVAAEWWRDEIVRLTNTAAYQKLMQRRRAEWEDEGARRG